ncbi:hypothetical protein [Cyclobacterium sp.]|uniref:hypothetical protein n=1 Tax=Cyclobacterium sp. TaxID=1966343 RepID=UPI00198CAF50|nr:hypothetical protein [Cyclobacterium sp.]MBD3629973.1 hypothetical protein [Cyclobacterium sp.]
MEKDKMDRLIKEKLEDYHPEFSEAAWTDFLPHLKKIPWWRTWWAVVPVSGLFLLGTFIYFQYPGPETQQTSSIQIEEKAPNINSLSEGTDKSNQPFPNYNESEGYKIEKNQDLSEDLNEEIKEENHGNPTGIKGNAGKRKKIAFLKKYSEDKKKASAVNNVRSKRHYYSYRQKNPQSYFSLDTLSQQELLRHLLTIEDSTSSIPSATVKGTGAVYKIKEPLHWDLTVSPVVSWLYPVDGFSTTRLPYSEELFSWRFPGLNMALIINQKWSVSAGVLGGNTDNYISIGEGYPIENLTHFPDWSEVTYPVGHIWIESKQLLFPFSIKYHQKIIGDFGMNLKIGLLAHHIGDQKFAYNKPIFASSLGLSTSVSQNTWQLSYLEGGLGFTYDLSKRFSTYLEGEYWKGIQPIGGEQHKYHLMGVSIGVNYHLFPKE